MGKPKVTLEVHAQVRETLRDNGIMATARIHNLSPDTVSRIKRGGRSLTGYKRALNADHGGLPLERFKSKDELPLLEEPSPKRGLFGRFRRQRV